MVRGTVGAFLAQAGPPGRDFYVLRVSSHAFGAYGGCYPARSTAFPGRAALDDSEEPMPTKSLPLAIFAASFCRLPPRPLHADCLAARVTYRGSVLLLRRHAELVEQPAHPALVGLSSGASAALGPPG